MRNNYEIRGDVTAIYIIRKGKEHETLIDTTDLAKSQTISGTIHARRSRDTKHYYAFFQVGRKTIAFHRFLTDAPEGMEVDHFNHETLDNRRSTNLRVVTSGENNQNLKRYGRINNKSCGIRGVTFDSATGKWMVQVVLNKKHAYSGRFDKLEDAELAAREARAVHLPYSIEAATIVVKDPSKYIDYREMPNARNKSGVKNVYYCKRTERWKINIKVNGKNTPRSFSTKEMAMEMLKKFNNNELSIDEVIELKETSSGIKNIYYKKSFKKWCIQITINKKKKSFGYFSELQDAVNKLEEVRKEYKVS